MSEWGGRVKDKEDEMKCDCQSESDERVKIQKLALDKCLFIALFRLFRECNRMRESHTERNPTQDCPICYDKFAPVTGGKAASLARAEVTRSSSGAKLALCRQTRAACWRHNAPKTIALIIESR